MSVHCFVMLKRMMPSASGLAQSVDAHVITLILSLNVCSLLMLVRGQWLPDEAADWKAYSTGEPNEKIIKDPAARQYIGQWDVAIFRGGQHGLYIVHQMRL